MFLGDRDIIEAMAQGRVNISPQINTDLQVQPASLDLRLGGEFLTKKQFGGQDRISRRVLGEGESFVLDPLEFVLGHTLETVSLVCPPPQLSRKVYPLNNLSDYEFMQIPIGGNEKNFEPYDQLYTPRPLCAMVEGRSSIGREGISVHVTAGFIDPGFVGQITLEIFNASSIPFHLVVGMRICQLIFAEVGQVERPYGPLRGSKYQYQRGAVPSRMALDTE